MVSYWEFSPDTNADAFVFFTFFIVSGLDKPRYSSQAEVQLEILTPIKSIV